MSRSFFSSLKYIHVCWSFPCTTGYKQHHCSQLISTVLYCTFPPADSLRRGWLEETGASSGEFHESLMRPRVFHVDTTC